MPKIDINKWKNSLRLFFNLIRGLRPLMIPRSWPTASIWIPSGSIGPAAKLKCKCAKPQPCGPLPPNLPMSSCS